MAACTHENSAVRATPEVGSSVRSALGTTAGRQAGVILLPLGTLAGASPYGTKNVRSISNCTASQSGVRRITRTSRAASSPSAAAGEAVRRHDCDKLVQMHVKLMWGCAEKRLLQAAVEVSIAEKSIQCAQHLQNHCSDTERGASVAAEALQAASMSVFCKRDYTKGCLMTRRQC